MFLNDSHIDFITQKLESKGLIYEPLRDEILDHFCSLVEDEMQSGTKFREAFDLTMKKFGSGKQLREIQSHTIKNENFNTIAMFKNYFKIGIRNMLKYKFYSVVNILGLAIGIASIIILSLYIQNEVSYDRHFTDADQIFRINSDHLFNNSPFHASVTPAPLAFAVLQDYPEVVASTRIRDIQSIIFQLEDNTFKEASAAYADSTLFEVFDFELLEGNPEKILRRPSTVLLAESTAKKYFGEESAIGKTLKTSSGAQWTVEGVFKDIPKTSHFDFTVFISMSSYPKANNDMWLSNNFYSYVKLLEGSHADRFEQKLDQLIVKYIAPQLKSMVGMDLDKAAETGTKAKFYLMPLLDIHLKSHTSVEIMTNGDVLYVYIFLSIALFILIIACINFMNLATARSATRAKEVGVRKVMGSLKSHLVKQFLTESFLLVFLAYILALFIAQLILPFFNSMAQLDLSIPLSNHLFILFSLFGVLILSIIAGSYPAFYLSSFKPVSILGGLMRMSTGKSWFRSSLVIFQFAISIFLIAATAIIYNQLNFIQSKKLGFNKDQVLIIHDTYLLQNQVQSYRDALETYAEISSASISSFLPTTSARSDNTYFLPGMSDLESAVNMQSWRADEKYISTYGLSLITGRDFDPANAADNNAVILNRTASALFGFTDPVGKEISTFFYDPQTGSINADSIVSYNVIGLIEDFHFSSFKTAIKPLGLFYSPSTQYTAIRFKGSDAARIIEIASNEWEKTEINQPFAYSFLDERFNEMYVAENRTGKIFASFAILAIIIACLGLFALSAYTVERRTKEIGIRKVMGASNTSIMYMLSKEFGKLVLIAFLIALPFVYFGADWWLNVFAYKSTPGVTVYLLPGIAAILIAVITMSFQSVRAARSNPAKSLRNE